MSADNAVIYYEASYTAKAIAALTDSGDSKFFESADTLWSNAAGAEAVVRPNGLIAGGVITPADSNDAVDVASLSCYQSGVNNTVAKSDALAIGRPTVSDFVKYSIVVNDSQVITAVKGTEGDAFSDTRDADGGPPYIAVGSVEIGQVFLSSKDAALITVSEIKQVVNVNQERFDFPTWTEKRINVTAGIMGNAGVQFAGALPSSHTAGVPKQVFASYAEPDFGEIPKSSAFVPPETTHSVSSTQIYGMAIGTSSSSLNQGSFTAYLEDGITDALLQKKDQTLFFKFKSNRLKTPYILAQGKFGIARTFPAGDAIQAACTVSATEGAVEVTA